MNGAPALLFQIVTIVFSGALARHYPAVYHHTRSGGHHG